MAEDWVPVGIDGAVRRRLTAHDDVRGGFSELWRSSWTATVTAGAFVQSNLSISHAGVLRGMHFHLRQADLWIVLAGRAWGALADLRGARTEPQWRPRTASFELERGDAIYIPERIAHGILAVEELWLLYLVTNEFDGTDELGFAWDDPDAAIPWPAREPMLSDRDRANPPLRVAIRQLDHGQIDAA